MTTSRAVIRYTYTEQEKSDKPSNGLVTAYIPGTTKESAVKYLIKKYPDRKNIAVTEVVFTWIWFVQPSSNNQVYAYCRTNLAAAKCERISC